MQPPDGITLDSDYIIHNNYKFVNDPQSVSFFSHVGLSMMCYKNQKTSPKDKKEYK